MTTVVEYYFNNLQVNNRNILNHKTGLYDLTIVDDGTPNPSPSITTFPETINSVSTYALNQSISDLSNYSYCVNTTNSFVNSIGRAGTACSIGFWMFNPPRPTTSGNWGMLFSIASPNFSISVAHRTRSETNIGHQFLLTVSTPSGHRYISINIQKPQDPDKFLLDQYIYNLINITTDASNAVRFDYYVNDSSYNIQYGTDLVGFTTSNPFTTNIPNTLPTGNQNLYILGGPSTSNLTFPANGANSKSIGFKGKISQFFIYNSVVNISSSVISPPPPENPTNRICEYYFNDIIKNNRIKNYTTSRYDLSSVNVGNGLNTIQPFKTTISNISTYAIKQILAQVADSSTNYCYYVNDSTTIKTLGNASSFSVSFWANNNSFDSSFGILFAISDTSNNFISVSQKFNASTNSNIIINIGNTSANQSHTREFSPGTNAYNHYLIIYNYVSSPTNIQITLYVNGVQINNLGTVGSNNVTGTTNITNVATGFTSTTPIFNGNASLYILGGPLNTSLTYPNGGTASNGAATSISNFIIYIPVNSTEINYLYNNIVPVSLYTNNYTFYSKNSYNINNTKLLYYYPLTTDFSDYKTGTAVINTTVSSNITFGTSSIAAVDPNIKFINGYADFSNNTTGGIQIPSTLINPGGITIAFWAKFNNIATYPNQRLFECYNSSSDIGNKFLSIFTTSNRINISTKATISVPITNYSLLNNADWHHYCVIISSAGVWTLYVDGVSYTTQFTNHYPVSALYLNCTIGSTYNTSPSSSIAQTPKETFITQFVLFNRAITPTELSYLVNYPSQVTFSSAATQFTPKAKYVTAGHAYSDPLNRTTGITYLPEGGNISTDWVPVISVMNYSRIGYNITSIIKGGYDISGCVANNGKVWVAGINYDIGGGSSFDPDASINASLLYSYDAVNWIPVVNSRNIIGIVNGIEYGNNMFVAVGGTRNSSNTPIIAYSYDGIIWTNANINNVFSNISSVISIHYKNSIWIASGISSSTSNKLMATSTNGISWTGITIESLLNKEIADIDYNGSIWVAVGLSDPSSNSNIIYSPDFTNWYGVPSTSNFGTKGTSIKWGNGKFIAVGHGTANQNVIKTSTDGVNWTNITNIPTTPTNLSSNTVSSVNYDPYSNIWFITNIGSPRSLIYSTDNGVTWNNTNVNDSGTYEGYSFSYLFQEPPPCFLEGSKILKFDPISEKESYVPVETLRKGDLIKTFMSGYKPISHIGCRILVNPAETLDIRDRLYSLSAKQLNPDSEFDEPLYLTGRHSVLHRNLSQKQITVLKKYMGNIYETENHYRVPIFLDARAKRSTDNKNVIIWHFALEHPDRQQNYGVYANGILVESSSAEYMTEHSNMDLLD